MSSNQKDNQTYYRCNNCGKEENIDSTLMGYLYEDSIDSLLMEPVFSCNCGSEGVLKKATNEEINTFLGEF